VKEVAVINLDYIGSVLSVNRCWIVRAGRRTNTLRAEVKEWREQLSVEASKYNGRLTPPVFIRFSANFKDHRHPDMDNLRKVTCDGLKVGLGIDDKYFLTFDGDVQVNPNIPAQLVLEIWDKECENPPIDLATTHGLILTVDEVKKRIEDPYQNPEVDPHLDPLIKSKLSELARLVDTPDLGG
jgi:Holliday junction resolvase RusA-like endonuclease